MSTYFILESNLDRLENKLKAIERKCKKLGCSFIYKKTGEIFKDIEVDGQLIKSKFIVVEAGGSAVINGWRLVASLEPTPNGNRITQFDLHVSVPKDYYYCDICCDHCNTLRNRKHSYLLYNHSKDEWKQVGKSCLREFTGGLDAESAARYVSWFETLIEGQSPSGDRQPVKYYPVLDVLRYAVECVNKFGYVSNADAREQCRKSTSHKAFSFYLLDNNLLNSSDIEVIRNQMIESKFNSNDADVIRTSNEIFNWVTNYSGEPNEYMHNLSVIFKNMYMRKADVSIVVSSVKGYQNHLRYEAEALRRQAEHDAQMVSVHVGNIGDKIEFDGEASVISNYDTQWGMSTFYKIVDTEGNVYTWYTSTCIECGKKLHFKATVKDHDEFNGIKQTKLTRCRVTELN